MCPGTNPVSVKYIPFIYYQNYRQLSRFPQGRLKKNKTKLKTWRIKANCSEILQPCPFPNDEAKYLGINIERCQLGKIHMEQKSLTRHPIL